MTRKHFLLLLFIPWILFFLFFSPASSGVSLWYVLYSIAVITVRQRHIGMSWRDIMLAPFTGKNALLFTEK